MTPRPLRKPRRPDWPRLLISLLIPGAGFVYGWASRRSSRPERRLGRLYVTAGIFAVANYVALAVVAVFVAAAAMAYILAGAAFIILRSIFRLGF